MAKKQLKVNLIPAIRRLEATIKGLVTTSIVGTYKSAFKGKGLEFEDYREYNSGDDASKIDWKASARTNKLLVKEYIEERNLNVFFIVDVSDNMIFGSTEKLKNEYAAELVASIAYITLRSGDRIGFTMFNNKPVKKSFPEGGMDQFYILSRDLLNPNNYGGEFDFNEALKFLLSFMKEKGLVIIVSDFIRLKKGWEERLNIASKKFDIIAMIVRDPRDENMPDEDIQVILSNPYENKQLIVNTKEIKTDYERIAKEETNKFKQKLTELNVDFIELITSKSFVNPIMTFFKRRHDKWR